MCQTGHNDIACRHSHGSITLIRFLPLEKLSDHRQIPWIQLCIQPQIIMSHCHEIDRFSWWFITIVQFSIKGPLHRHRVQNNRRGQMRKYFYIFTLLWWSTINLHSLNIHNAWSRSLIHFCWSMPVPFWYVILFDFLLKARERKRYIHSKRAIKVSYVYIFGLSRSSSKFELDEITVKITSEGSNGDTMLIVLMPVLKWNAKECKCEKNLND